MPCSEADISKLVLDRFNRMWVPLHPKGTSEHVAERAEYIRALTPWDLDALRLGVDHAMQHHRTQRWPTIAQLRGYIDKALADRGAHAGLRLEKPNHKRAAKEILRSPIGQQACHEGWARSLYLFILENGPQGSYPVAKWLIAAEYRRRWAERRFKDAEADHPDREDLVTTAVALCAAEGRVAVQFMAAP